MSPANENMEQLFAAAKSLPGELSLKEVELTFLNPAPIPPAQPWYGSYLKFFTMLSFLLATVLTVTLSSSTGNQVLTEPPFTENIISADQATTPTALNPVEIPDSRLTEPTPATVNTIVPTTILQLPVLAPQRVIAPAAAPPEVPLLVTPLNSESLKPVRPVIMTPGSDYKSPTDLPIPIFNGEWKLKKSRLNLSLREVTSDEQEQLFFLPAALTTAEMEALHTRNATAAKLERDAGTLLLYGGKKRGTFKFIPNASFRDRLNAIGLGDRQLPEGENPRIPVLPALIKPGSCSDTDHPRELLWLKYFVYNVNDSYMKVLYNHGYTDSELVGLYHLPDYGVKRLTLINLLSLTDQIFVERVPIKDLARMSWRITYLNYLIRSGHKEMTLEDFWNRKDIETLSLNLLGRTEALKSPLIGLKGTPALTLKNEPLIGNLGTPFSLFADSTTHVFGAPLVDFELPDNWGTSVPGQIATTLDITALSKLVVKGNIRLYLNYSDAPREIVVFASPTATSDLVVKHSGGKVTLKNTHPSELIDIEVSGPQLQSIRTAGHALFFKKAKKRE